MGTDTGQSDNGREGLTICLTDELIGREQRNNPSDDSLQFGATQPPNAPSNTAVRCKEPFGTNVTFLVQAAFFKVVDRDADCTTARCRPTRNLAKDHVITR